MYMLSVFVCTSVHLSLTATNLEIRRSDRSVGDQSDGRCDSGRRGRQVEAGRSSWHGRRQRRRGGSHGSRCHRHEVSTQVLQIRTVVQTLRVQLNVLLVRRRLTFFPKYIFKNETVGVL